MIVYCTSCQFSGVRGFIVSREDGLLCSTTHSHHHQQQQRQRYGTTSFQIVQSRNTEGDDEILLHDAAPSRIKIPVEALILRLFSANRDVDSMCWFIALNFLDALTKKYYAEQQSTENSRRLLPLHRIRIPEDSKSQTLFSIYCLACKWHIDYTVKIRYLTSLLHCNDAESEMIVAAAAADERLLLQELEYNCYVDFKDVQTLLTRHFLCDELTIVCNIFSLGRL